MLRELIQHAGSLGTQVHFAPIGDEPDLLGFYSPTHDRIIVRLGLTMAQSRWVLAHELGHAFHRHSCGDPRSRARAERQADAYGARLLIDPAEYARLEHINPDRHWLAEEFGVHVDAIYAYEAYCLTRTDGATYAHARLGSGQWSFRA